jgi:recombination protein RecT
MTNDIVKYMQNETVKVRFEELMGERDASAYISSVLLAVANSPQLSECTPASIYTSALRAATLRLSVDAGLGQAYLVPFKRTATLIIGYKGLYDLAVRTNQYRYINVGKIYEGEEIIEDRLSGFIKIGGVKKSDTVIGFIGAFEMVNGFAKVIYMTCEEIDAHAKKYSKTYNRDDSLWKTETMQMMRKTVLRILLRKWGYFNPGDAQMIETVEGESDFIDAVAEDVPEEPEQPKAPPRKASVILDELGYDSPYPPEEPEAPEPPQPVKKEYPEPSAVIDLETAKAVTNSKGVAYGSMDTHVLEKVLLNIENKLDIDPDYLERPEAMTELNYKRDAALTILRAA